MRILIVGAGSIGQLYGHIANKGGAHVGVYVREKYVDDAREGFRLYDLRGGRGEPEQFYPEAVLCSPDELTDSDWDAALLCIPSTGLRGEWLESFCRALGDATIVSLTPGLEDRDYLGEHVDDERLATGLITAISYPGPLPGEPDYEPGTAYWLPPLTPAMFDGPKKRLTPLLEHLQEGGMSTRVQDDLHVRAGFALAAVSTFVAELESADWSFEAVKRSRDHRSRFDSAFDEAAELVEDRYDARRPLPMKFLGPLTVRGALSLAPIVPPFDLETYLRVHFTKVGDQTRQHLDEFIDARTQRDWDSPALRTQREAIN